MTDEPKVTLHKDTQVIKEKETIRDAKDRCKVVYHHSYGSYGSEGGYGDIYVEVTDDTSQKAYETVQKLILGLEEQQDPNEPPVKINKRASSAVDVR